MRRMVLLLVLLVEEPQMFPGPAEMVFGTPLHPFIVRVGSYPFRMTWEIVSSAMVKFHRR